METVGYTLVGLAGAGILLMTLDESSFLHQLLRTRWLAAIGRISYGIYFFHYFPSDYFGGFREKHLAPHHLGLLLLPLAFAYSYGIASLSFRYLESPFLRLKKVLAPGHLSIPPAETASRG